MIISCCLLVNLSFMFTFLITYFFIFNFLLSLSSMKFFTFQTFLSTIIDLLICSLSTFQRFYQIQSYSFLFTSTIHLKIFFFNLFLSYQNILIMKSILYSTTTQVSQDFFTFYKVMNQIHAFIIIKKQTCLFHLVLKFDYIDVMCLFDVILVLQKKSVLHYCCYHFYLSKQKLEERLKEQMPW